jgi:DNA-binding NarL/FixJ family response regulator
MTIQLLVVEDHDLVREGLRATFEETEIDIVGEATTYGDAVRLASADGSDVVLLDIKIPNGDGFDVLRTVKSVKPELAVLVYSQHDRQDFRQRARALGASGYLTKRARGAELIDAIRTAARGESLWPASGGDREHEPKQHEVTT